MAEQFLSRALGVEFDVDLENRGADLRGVEVNGSSDTLGPKQLARTDGEEVVEERLDPTFAPTLENEELS